MPTRKFHIMHEDRFLYMLTVLALVRFRGWWQRLVKKLKVIRVRFQILELLNFGSKRNHINGEPE